MALSQHRHFIKQRLALSTALVCILVSLVACSANGDLANETDPTHFFTHPDPDFNIYRNQVSRYLNANSISNRTSEGIALNLPFRIAANPEQPYRGKFLLIHGLNDSSYVWHDLSVELAHMGFDVRAILLPGHGSRAEDMLEVSYKSWITAARNHLNQMREENTPIYVGGFSLGGVIATILALEEPPIAGLMLVSPAFHSTLNSLLRWSWIYKKIEPWMFGTKLMEDNPTKYNSIPINSGDQYFRTTTYLKRRWDNRKLTMPVFSVVSTNDSVVDISYTRKLFKKRFTSPENRLIIYSDDKTEVASNNETIRISAYPSLRILNQSHLSLINKPANPLMGQEGSQLICNGNKPEIFFGCMAATGHWFGAQHTASPDGVSVARTTYNPDYDYLVQQIATMFAK